MLKVDPELNNQSAAEGQGRASPLFQGEYAVTRDAQGRIVVPSACRPGFGGEKQAMVGPAPDGASVYIFPVETWREWVGALREARAEGDREAGWLLRLYTSLYDRCTIQGKAHRIALSDSVAELAGIGRGEAARIVGKDDRLHVFSEQRWATHRSELLDAVKQIPEDSRWKV